MPRRLAESSSQIALVLDPTLRPTLFARQVDKRVDAPRNHTRAPFATDLTPVEPWQQLQSKRRIDPPNSNPVGERFLGSGKRYSPRHRHNAESILSNSPADHSGKSRAFSPENAPSAKLAACVRPNTADRRRSLVNKPVDNDIFKMKPAFKHPGETRLFVAKDRRGSVIPRDSVRSNGILLPDPGGASKNKNRS